MKRIAITTALAASFAASAAAANLEFGHEYEAAYLQQCERDHGERVCRCSMEAMQARIGFEEFADQVDREREQVSEPAEARITWDDLLARCSAVGSLQ